MSPLLPIPSSSLSLPAEPPKKPLNRWEESKLLPFRPDHPIHINEVFVSFQGEGPSLGRPSTFLRLAGCDLHCNFCDTPDTWQPALLRSIRTTIGQVLDDVLSREPHRLVITGGEPMLQQLRLVPLLSELRKRSRKPHGFPYFVEVETNGTHFPNRGMLQLVDRFNVSPKLLSSGNPASAINPATLNQFLDYPGKSIFKFVVTGPDDIFWIESVCRDANLPPSLVWLMPEGVTSDKIVSGLRSLADVALAHSWNLTPRLQNLIWNDRRGV